MSDAPNDDQPGLVSEKLEHCFACYRLIRPGQIYYLTIEGLVHCKDCALSEGVIRVRDNLAVEVKRDRLVIQRGVSVGKGARHPLGTQAQRPHLRSKQLPYSPSSRSSMLSSLYDDLLQQRRPDM